MPVNASRYYVRQPQLIKPSLQVKPFGMSDTMWQEALYLLYIGLSRGLGDKVLYCTKVIPSWGQGTAAGASQGGD